MVFTLKKIKNVKIKTKKHKTNFKINKKINIKIMASKYLSKIMNCMYKKVIYPDIRLFFYLCAVEKLTRAANLRGRFKQTN